MENETNNVGRPLKFETPEELQEKINEYFESCYKPVRILIKDTNQYINLTNENGEIIKEQYKPFTMSGLAYALGIDRKTLLNYSKKDEFFPTISRAKQRCEIYAEERLYDRDGNRGAIFSLTNNFNNWSDKQTIETTKEPVININMINNDNLQEDFFKEEENG